MSEYPIKFSDGTWGWKHALDNDFNEPDIDEDEFEKIDRRGI